MAIASVAALRPGSAGGRTDQRSIPKDHVTRVNRARHPRAERSRLQQRLGRNECLESGFTLRAWFCESYGLLRCRLTDLMNHLEDCFDCSVWLIKFNIVTAVFCNQLLTIG